MTRRLLALGLAMATLVLGGVTARAESMTLGSLISTGGTLQAGDLEFSNFSYSPSGIAPAPGDVNVVTLTDTGRAGLEFQVPFSASGDALITYTVTSTAGAITSAHVTGNPAVVGGTGLMEVVDTLYAGTSISGSPIAQTAIYDNHQITPPSTLLSADVPGLSNTTITVKKDIEGVSGPTGTPGTPTLSYVDQTYSDPPSPVVPEPMSMALLGIGLTGLFTFRRFLKRAFAA